MSQSLRVGILTGGGDCPGLNAVIRAVGKCLILQHNARVIGIENGFEGLIKRNVRSLDYKDVSGILTLGGTVLGTSNKCDPFNYYASGGADVSAELVANYKSIGLDAIVAIGGDGTLTIAQQLSEKGINVVGVPKTIDNDLVATDRTFGFDTAVSIAAEAIDRLQTTAQSHQRVMIIETMGRYAGWIGLYAGAAGGADVILIPEIPYDLQEVIKVCTEREHGGQHFTIICIAEGAKPIGGSQVAKQHILDSPDPIRLGGIANYLAESLRSELRSEIRTSVLGHIQRGGSPTAYDRNLATAFGAYAAEMVARGEFGKMVSLQNNSLTSVSLKEVAGKNRLVPLNSPMIAAALAVGTSFGVSGMRVELGDGISAGSIT